MRFSKIFQIWKILESARAKNFLKKHLTNRTIYDIIYIVKER